MALENALVLYDSCHNEKISMAIQYSNYMVRVSGATLCLAKIIGMPYHREASSAVWGGAGVKVGMMWGFRWQGRQNNSFRFVDHGDGRSWQMQFGTIS
jgi:hypothetical protein